MIYYRWLYLLYAQQRGRIHRRLVDTFYRDNDRPQMAGFRVKLETICQGGDQEGPRRQTPAHLARTGRVGPLVFPSWGQVSRRRPVRPARGLEMEQPMPSALVGQTFLSAGFGDFRVPGGGGFERHGAGMRPHEGRTLLLGCWRGFAAPGARADVRLGAGKRQEPGDRNVRPTTSTENAWQSFTARLRTRPSSRCRNRR